MQDGGGNEMNHMKEVAHMLGVELGERFKVSGMDGRFWIDEIGLCVEDDKGDYDLNALLAALLTGRSKIVHLPYKPKIGDAYYLNTRFGETHHEWVEDDNLFDLMIIKLGKVYRTEEEAEAHAEEDTAFWRGIQEELKQ